MAKSAWLSTFVTGFDLHALLATVRLTIAPLRTGAGAKLRLLDSLAAGMPAVGTSSAAEGTGLRDGDGLILAAGADTLAQAVAPAYGSALILRALPDAGLNPTRCSAPKAVRAQRWAPTGVPSGIDDRASVDS